VIRLLWLIPTIPFVSATLLILLGSRFSRRMIAALGVGSIGLSAALAILVAASFMTAHPPGGGFTQVLWTWMDVAGFRPEIGFYLDALSLLMILVATCIGFLIHIYSAEFMIEDPGLRPLLRLHEPVCRIDDYARAGQQSAPSAAWDGKALDCAAIS
jgi:NADH-quinone oxidoreductase subunit L